MKEKLVGSSMTLEYNLSAQTKNKPPYLYIVYNHLISTFKQLSLNLHERRSWMGGKNDKKTAT